PLYRGMKSGKNGFSGISHFDTSPYVSSLAGMIPGLFPEKANRFETLTDHLISLTGKIGPETLVITASTKGGIENAGRIPPENLRVSALPGHVSGQLGLKRQGINISAACASSTIALAKAARMIRNGSEESVLVFAMDLVSEFVFSGFSAIGAMSSEPARPFDADRNGLTLGEGGAVLMLMNEKRLSRTGTAPLAELSGWGVAGDAVHLTAPDRNGSGLKSAITKACRTAGLPHDRIRVINTHGTGTLYNDAMELEAITSLFDQNRIMAHSVKGAIGHTLGAAGAIEAALCTRLLETKCLPGTTGMTTPAPKAGKMFSHDCREFDTDTILTTNSGFGGINAALILRKIQ
ncbi:MAG: hypothetical protein MI863_05665, partial [Desulfobacterales bacterium]|nr:hypothetical protein [Desulfobacterales bacterium]